MFRWTSIRSAETRRGKTAAIERFTVIVHQFDFLRFDTSDLMIQRNRAGIEIPIHYRHKESGLQFETTIVNFWTFEDGWPVSLTEYYVVSPFQDLMTVVGRNALASNRTQ